MAGPSFSFCFLFSFFPVLRILLFSLLQAQRVDGGGVPLLQLRERFQGFLRVSAASALSAKRQERLRGEREEEISRRGRGLARGEGKAEDREENLRLDLASNAVKYDDLKRMIDMVRHASHSYTRSKEETHRSTWRTSLSLSTVVSLSI